ncbi:hypothetical protein F2P56_027637, partial [Juglans regia]
RDACTKFMELWRRKHETGQWVEVAATEAMSNQSDFSAMNTSGIMLANVDNKQKEYELVLENNGKASSATSADDKSPVDHKTPLGHQEYFQGQLESKYSSKPSEFNRLYDMVRTEVAAKTAKASSSCTNGLLWLTR